MSHTAFLPAARDYGAVPHEVVFPTGTTQKIVAIPIIEDSVLEAKESFSMRVTVPASHAGVLLLGTDVATISITDNDSKWMFLSARWQ